MDHGPLVELYEKARKVKGVKHLFVGSGVRYDLAQADAKNGARYLKALVQHHVSGQLKVAPEHVCEPVLKVMKKPGVASFERLRKDFERYSREAGKEQYLVPYFISSHPGASLEQAAELMDYLQANRWKPQQVQDFMPTPMTLASDMYWSGYHPIDRQAGARDARHGGEAHAEGAAPLGRSGEPAAHREGAPEARAAPTGRAARAGDAADPSVPEETRPGRRSRPTRPPGLTSSP